jgi:GNAT superfamily N-acetyltransferase
VLRIERLTRHHDRRSFSCGQPSLEEWLSKYARQNQDAHNATTYVLTDEEAKVWGYYSLAMSSVSREHLPGLRNAPEPIPGILIGRLAVHDAVRGTGLGADLLRDALERSLAASTEIAARVVLVHALDEDGKAFYEHFGFRASPVHPRTLMLPITEIEATYAAEAPDAT